MYSFIYTVTPAHTFFSCRRIPMDEYNIDQWETNATPFHCSIVDSYAFEVLALSSFCNTCYTTCIHVVNYC